MPERTYRRPTPLAVFDGKLLPFIQATYLEWVNGLDVAPIMENFNIRVNRDIQGGVRVLFHAKRQPDEIGLKGGRCKNGQDIEFRVNSELKVIGYSFFK